MTLRGALGMLSAGVLVVGVVVLASLAGLVLYMVAMPGDSFRGPLPQLDADGQALAARLEDHVRILCRNPDGRSHRQTEALKHARDYIAEQFRAQGHQVAFQEYQVRGQRFENIEVELTGAAQADEIVVVGAHYDSVTGVPGANDNGSGVAALLEFGRIMGGPARHARTLRLVAFVNEEPPFFQAESMGSVVYAGRSAARSEKIVAMLTLETIGYFTDSPGSQRYPYPFGLLYPSRGDFVGFVGNLSSRALVRDAVALFRQHAAIPSEGVAAPGFIPGVGWSDQWAFWLNHYPAIMVTDTAVYRYPHYHRETDTPDKIDYASIARVLLGVVPVVEALANRE